MAAFKKRGGDIFTRAVGTGRRKIPGSALPAGDGVSVDGTQTGRGAGVRRGEKDLSGRSESHARYLRIGAIAAVLLAAAIWCAAADFAGAEACAECHSKQFQAQRATRHAKALRRIRETPL